MARIRREIEAEFLATQDFSTDFSEDRISTIQKSSEEIFRPLFTSFLQKINTFLKSHPVFGPSRSKKRIQRDFFNIHIEQDVKQIGVRN